MLPSERRIRERRARETQSENIAEIKFDQTSHEEDTRISKVRDDLPKMLECVSESEEEKMATREGETEIEV